MKNIPIHFKYNQNLISNNIINNEFSSQIQNDFKKDLEESLVIARKE